MIAARSLFFDGADIQLMIILYMYYVLYYGFPHPHEEHMIDTFSCIFYFI